MRNAALYRALENFEFDPPGSAGAFAGRLAREQGWTPEYTRRVIDEYLRFLYLAVTGESAATPSNAVDEVWHLHLIYTRSYWDELCQEILARPLHHDPSTGGAAEDGRHARQYSATLEYYRQEFGEPPPRDIWRIATDQSAPPEANPSRSRWLLRAAIPALGAAALAIAAAATENSGTDAPIPALFSLTDILMGALVFALAGLVPGFVFALIVLITNPLLDPVLGPALEPIDLGWIDPLPITLAVVIIAFVRLRKFRFGRETSRQRRSDSGGSGGGGGACGSGCGGGGCGGGD